MHTILTIISSVWFICGIWMIVGITINPGMVLPLTPRTIPLWKWLAWNSGDLLYLASFLLASYLLPGLKQIDLNAPEWQGAALFSVLSFGVGYAGWLANAVIWLAHALESIRAAAMDARRSVYAMRVIGVIALWMLILDTPVELWTDLYPKGPFFTQVYSIAIKVQHLAGPILLVIVLVTWFSGDSLTRWFKSDE